MDIMETLEAVMTELDFATTKFPTWPTDPLHAVAVLGEEYGELNKAVLQHTYEPHKSGLEDVRAEAVQTAAMALRFIMSLDQYRYQACEQHEQIVEDNEQEFDPNAGWCPGCTPENCSCCGGVNRDDYIDTRPY